MPLSVQWHRCFQPNILFVDRSVGKVCFICVGFVCEIFFEKQFISKHLGFKVFHASMAVNNLVKTQYVVVRKISDEQIWMYT